MEAAPVKPKKNSELQTTNGVRTKNPKSAPRTNRLENPRTNGEAEFFSSPVKAGLTNAYTSKAKTGTLTIKPKTADATKYSIIGAVKLPAISVTPRFGIT